MKKEIAVIIPTFNRLDYLIKLISDLKTQTVKRFTTVVVDASDTDSIQEYIQKQVSINIKYVKVNSAKYWTGTINAGILYSKNKLSKIEGIILLNDDTRIKKDFIENIYTLSVKHKNSLIGCVNVDIKDKTTIHWAGTTTNKWLAITKYLYRNRQIQDIDKHKNIQSFTLIGRGVYIPIEVFDKIGYFDEKHIVHRSDTEFPLRAKKANYKLLVSFLPVVYIYHDETYQYDYGKMKLKDYKNVFFDFRSSSNIKTRYYFAKSATTNKIQHIVFFTVEMLIHIRRFVLRLF